MTRIYLSSIIILVCSIAFTVHAAVPNPVGFITTSGPTDNQTTLTIEQHGITWTFGEPVQYGQFVNGDYWVVDPGNGVKIVNITPGHTLHPETGRHMNGSMLNPYNMPQGYDQDRDYNADRNVGINVTYDNPLVLPGNSSLVSTISNLNPGGTSHVSYVKTAAVLTCLPSQPAPDSFRPGISSLSKTIHNANNLDYSNLKSLPYPDGINKIDISTYSEYFRMVWLDHGGWTTRFMRPSDGIPENYYYTSYFTEAALMLHLDYSIEEKKKLLINFIQLGIDLYSLIERGLNHWSPNGGNANGRKWPIMFAGIMLDYLPMKNIGQKSGNYLYTAGYGPGSPPPDYIHFGEDGQTFYVTEFDVDITNGPTWSPDTRSAPNYPYTSAMIGMPEWGIRHSTKPNISDASWTAMYRTIATAAKSWVGDSIAIRIMGAKELWNNDAYFDYVDRYEAISQGKPDPFGYSVPGERTGGAASGLTKKMYDTYRNQF